MKLINLQCVLADNNEIIFYGRSLGFLTEEEIESCTTPAEVATANKELLADCFYVGQDIQVQIDRDNPAWFDEVGNLMIEGVWEALGDMDVVECNEINRSAAYTLWVDSAQNVFHWYNSDVKALKTKGYCRLYCIGTLKENIDLAVESDRNFLLWYFGADTLETALGCLS